MVLETPIIIVNFKFYREASGKDALKLAKDAEAVAQETGIKIAVSPNTVDLRLVTKGVKIPIYAQHVDPVGLGAYTGHISPYYIGELGVEGTLLN
ncbi:MAG: triose-phosphate isomerase, partial [Nitrososphaeria archaeon]|nr:triose-phosphate isomerase [Nitrososphaeria archaeon]NIN52771.1 triose-phosphate isomerase [Nitrososphaeria archaeon]NIQ33324.1 triose-phosphate isomerase [Nitrososphaeria archaeon]